MTYVFLMLCISGKVPNQQLQLGHPVLFKTLVKCEERMKAEEVDLRKNCADWSTTCYVVSPADD